jgi:hypothetical protein
MIKRRKLDIQREREEAITSAVCEYFGGITKGEAIEVFKVLSLLAQFPGAKPPEPLTGHDIIWSSCLRVGDTLDKQTFQVEVTYKGSRFILSANGDRGLQLPDSSFIPLENWDYQAARVAERVTGGIYAR